MKIQERARILLRGEEVKAPQNLIEEAVSKFNERCCLTIEVFGEINPDFTKRLELKNISHRVGKLDRRGDDVYATIYVEEGITLPSKYELVIRPQVKFSEFDYVDEISFLTVDIIGVKN